MDFRIFVFPDSLGPMRTEIFGSRGRAILRIDLYAWIMTFETIMESPLSNTDLKIELSLSEF